jgi:DNA-binding response OmpR family regulator
LLIEDTPDTVELMRRILTARGYEFVSPSDAETGMQTALTTYPI